MESFEKCEEEKEKEPKVYFLGIDIGTTSVKVCVIDEDGKCVSQNSQNTDSDLVASDGEHTQNPVKILRTVQTCMSNLDKSILTNVIRIGICGQMHGVCLWKYDSEKPYGDWKISKLYTWMDQRCNSEFIATLPRPNSNLKLSTGHGCATLFWLSKFKPDEIYEYDSAGTIMDLLVSILCKLPKPIMSNQNAASWGYFDTKTNEFNIDILKSAEFPIHLLPKVESHSVVRGLKIPYFGIKTETPVGVALGDFQCSVLASLSNFDWNDMKKHAFVNISTSAQIGYICQEAEKSNSGVEYFPFFEDSYLAVGASLNGGNVLSHFVNCIKDLLGNFGVVTTTDNLWKVFLHAGESVTETQLQVSPLLFGERHLPDTKGSITNILTSNTNLGHFIRATCKGLVENLSSFISPKQLLNRGINTLIATGSALDRNLIMQEELRRKYEYLNVIINSSKLGSDYGVAEYHRLQYNARRLN